MGMTILGLGAAAIALDTAVNVAFPALSLAFGLPVSGIQWIIVPYMLTFGALMLISGRLGDRLGHVRVFRTGLFLSGVAFAIGASASSLEILVAARILQGSGAAAILSCAPALATFLYPETRRMQALALFGASFAIAQAAGPLLGGPVVELFGWRGVLALRIPFVLVAFLLAGRLVPSPHAGKPFHTPTALLLTASIAALLVAVSSLQWPHAWPLTLAGLLIGTLGAIATGRLQRTTASAFLPAGTLSDPRLFALNVLNATANAAAFSVLMLLPYALVARGLDVMSLGLVLAVSGAAISGASLAAPRLERTIGAEVLLAAGLALCIGGLAALGFWTPEAPILAGIAALAVQGIGLGFFSVAYADSVTGHLPVEDRGLAGGIVTATRTFGIVAGASLFSAIVRFSGESGAQGAAFALCFHIAAGVLAAASILMLAWYWVSQKSKRAEEAP